MKKIFAILLFVFASSAHAAPLEINARAPKIDLPALVQECPDFTSYPGYSGVVWQKNIAYEDTGGAISATTVWVVLGRKGIDKKWLEWEVPIPTDGRAEVFQSAIFDPGSLKEVARVEPIKSANALSVKFSPPDDEFVIVLTYQQIHTGKLTIQDVIWLSESLPVWEQVVSAKVQSGQKLEYKSNIGIEPVESASDGYDLYKWTLVNQLPAVARSLRTDARPWLAFGSGRRGGGEGLPEDGDTKKSASDNKLTLNFNLDLAEDGTLGGTLSVAARNTWKDFLKGTPSEILREIIGSNAERILTSEIAYKEVKNGFEMTAKLKPTKIILGTKGSNAIVPLPGVQPAWIIDLGKALVPFSLMFPLVIEANYRLNLHGKVNDVLLPRNVDIGFGKIKYLQKYSRRKLRVELTERLTLGNTSITTADEQDLKPAISRWLSQKTIPIREK